MRIWPTLLSAEPQILSSLHFEYNAVCVTTGTQRWITASGSLAGLLFGRLALIALKHVRQGSHMLFLRRFASLSFLQATGDFMFSGISNVGDWAYVIHGTYHRMAHRNRYR